MIGRKDHDKRMGSVIRKLSTTHHLHQKEIISSLESGGFV
jgi:hypothetical protein